MREGLRGRYLTWLDAEEETCDLLAEGVMLEGHDGHLGTIGGKGA